MKFLFLRLAARYAKPTLLAGLLCTAAFAQTPVADLRCEHRPNPLGVDTPQPRLSWQLRPNATQRNSRQTAYELRVLDERTGKPVWQTGRVTSDQSIDVPYAGPALRSGERYGWQVRVWDETGKPSPWSQRATWQMGLLQPADWRAQWIGPAPTADSGVSPLLRRVFTVRKPVRSATLFMTAHGLYEAHLNGQRIGDARLTPGWTAYQKRLQYQTYDVTPMLRDGANALGAALGSGWYRGFIGFSGQKNFYGKDVALLGQLHIRYQDGSEDVVATDGSWKMSTGAVRSDDIYNGETQDARRDQPGWTTATFNDATWAAAPVQDYAKNHLVATANELVRPRETFKVVSLKKTPKGELVADFGQNLVGFVRLRTRGPAGQRITISHAEVLDKFGNFYTDNLRSAKQQNHYVLRGSGEEVFEPRFTFQGFRYVKIDGLTPTADQLEAVALYSDMETTGQFTSSDALVNQLQHNIRWGQRGNFLDVPTDCPQRDERLGWTGDAQAFGRTAMFNMNTQPFFGKWLRDVALDQRPNGSVPFVVPNVLGDNAGGSTGWADVATIIPWQMYLAYGDKKVLEDQYASMKAWVGYMQANSTNHLWNKGFHFGDWLFFRPGDDNDGRAAVTDKYLISQCFFAHSTQLLINAARVLGRQDDVATYTELLKNVKDAFRQEYMTPTGRLVSGTQTAYVLALNFDMLPEALRPATAQRLVDNVKSYGHLTTGFLGTPYLCHVLTRFGYTDVAYHLLHREKYPSWLYPVKMGATTIWERWDGMKPDSTFQTPGMNSFNHYAYGAIGDWLYRTVAGLDTDESGPGYKVLRIQPHPGGKLTKADATLETPYGRARSAWQKEGSRLTLDVTVPPNTSAVIYVPAKSAAAVQEGGKAVDGAVEEAGYVKIKTGAGTYRFTVQE